MFCLQLGRASPQRTETTGSILKGAAIPQLGRETKLESSSAKGGQERSDHARLVDFRIVLHRIRIRISTPLIKEDVKEKAV